MIYKYILNNVFIFTIYFRKNIGKLFYDIRNYPPPLLSIFCTYISYVFHGLVGHVAAAPGYLAYPSCSARPPSLP